MARSITAEELRDRIDAGDDLLVVDTRNAEDFEGWHIAGARNVEYSATHSELRGDWEPVEADLAPDDEVVLVCAKGVSSAAFAEWLEARGYDDVVNVEGGMEAWSRVYDVVEIPTRDEDLVIFQIQRRAKGCLSYLVGSRSAGEAAVVDASRHTGTYTVLAGERGFDIRHVFDTHVHADHLSGGRALADEVGATYHLGERVEARDPQFEYDALARNEVIDLGEVQVKAVYTPGHTTEMASYLVDDEALLTGDTVFVESVGRTELEFTGEGAREGAKTMYRSLHGTVLAEPDSVKILPGHFSITDAGEVKDVTPGESMFSTVGKVRTGNATLQLDEAAFVERMFDTLPSKPPNYETVIETNLGRHALSGEDEATTLELGPNRCAATEESMVSDD